MVITPVFPRRHWGFDSGLDLIHLAVVEGLSGLHPGRLLPHVIIQWNPNIISPIDSVPVKLNQNLLDRRILMGCRSAIGAAMMGLGVRHAGHGE